MKINKRKPHFKRNQEALKDYLSGIVSFCKKHTCYFPTGNLLFIPQQWEGRVSPCPATAQLVRTQRDTPLSLLLSSVKVSPSLLQTCFWFTMVYLSWNPIPLLFPNKLNSWLFEGWQIWRTSSSQNNTKNVQSWNTLTTWLQEFNIKIL